MYPLETGALQGVRDDAIFVTRVSARGGQALCVRVCVCMTYCVYLRVAALLTPFDIGTSFAVLPFSFRFARYTRNQSIEALLSFFTYFSFLFV